MYDDDDFTHVVSVEQQEKQWKRMHSEVFKQGKWKKIEGHQLTADDIGKRVKFLWFIEWETSTNDIDGILKAFHPYPEEAYYCVAEIVGGTESDPRYHNYNVFGQTMYVQTS